MQQKRVRRLQSRHRTLYTQLEEEIVEGQLRPGDRLDETALAARFGVSRTPVREALLQLSSLGLIRLRPRRPALVTSLTVQQVIAMWEVLTTLEGFCAGLAARRMQPHERTELRAVCEGARPAAEARDIEAYDASNRLFHEALYAGAHNAYLIQQCRTIRRRVHVYRRYAFHQPGRIEISFGEHCLVLEAVIAGDEQRANELMRAHISGGGHAFVDMIAAMPEVVQ